MRRVGVVLSIGVMLILISWVTSPSARTPPPDPRVEPASPVELELSEQASQALDAQAAQLRVRLAAPPPRPEPSRNPFRFKGTYPLSTGSGEKGTYPISTDSREKGTGLVATPVAPVAPAMVLPTLVAITSDARDGGVMRTAVLSINDEMKIVRPGQAFDHFMVESIGPDSVRLVDISSPARRVFSILIR